MGDLVAWLARAVLFGGALASVGAGVLPLIGRQAGVDARVPTQRLTSIAMLAALVVLGERQVTAFVLPGDSRWEMAWTLLRYAPYGIGWFLQFTGATSLLLVPAGRSGLRLTFAIVIAAGFPFMGHAAAASPHLVAMTSDLLHVAAAGAWLGPLALLLVTMQRMPAPHLALLIDAFSPVALVAGGVVVASGVVSSLLHVTAVSDLWTLPYGRLLLAKLAVVAVAMAAGAWNWRVNRPRLRALRDVAGLRRVAMLEVAAAVLVLLVTAVLVHTDPNAGRP